MLLFLKNQQMVQAFLPHTSGEALADGVGSWCMNRRLEQLDATGPRHAAETGSKLAVVITYQILWCLPIRGGFSQVLGHPGIGRRSCHSHVNHLARLQLDNKAREEWSKEEISDLQEVTRPDLSCVVARDRSTISGLVAAACELLAYTSEWFACRGEGPASGVLRESFQRPRVDCPWPSLGSRQWFRRRPEAGEKRSWTYASNTGGRAPAALASLVSG